ncbi:MAG: M20/M25/M40 family metallo-hydrolase [Deltaproteobacteria bacterium]|nr:M20/M25/M40 family metallo-hydrolase [Deltaproteobacteria bacterium]
MTATDDDRQRIDPQRLKRLFHRMVDIYSPTGKEEELADYVRGYLKRKGLPVSLQEVDENRHNVLVVPPDTDIQIALVGHLDTVSAYELEEYGYSEEGDIITGLGTADMKGGCAAMMEAYLTLWRAGQTRLPVALCLVVGEEEEGDGAAQLVKEYHFPWVIIGEPTNLVPCLSHYGYAEIQVSTQGKRVHASLAGAASNAVQALLNVLLRISRHIQRKRPDLGLNIRDLYSSQSGFASPDYCEAWLDLHLPPSAPMGEIVTEVEEIFAKEKKRHQAVEGECRIATMIGGYELPEKGPVVNALKSIFNERAWEWSPRAFKSHSDANQLWAAGIKTLLFGPGSIEYAHAPQEAVAFQQVIWAAEVYKDLMLRIGSLHP